MPPARRGYGCVAGTPVVDGATPVPVQACQGSYAPVQAIGTVRHVGRRYGRTNVPPARALFSGKPQPEAQRAA